MVAPDLDTRSLQIIVVQINNSEKLRKITHVSSFLSSSGGAGPLACPRGSNPGPENKLHFKQEACFLKGIIINFFYILHS